MSEAVGTEAEHARSFEDFFHDHYERLLRVLYLSGGDRHEAEDLAQDAFVRVYERWPRVRTTGNPAGYLYRVALNARRSRLRRLAVATRKAFHLAPSPTADPHAATDDRVTIRGALAALPDGHLRDRMDQEARRVRGGPEAFQQVLSRAARRRRARRVASGVLGLALAAAGLGIAYAAFTPKDPAARPGGGGPAPGPSVSVTPTTQETPAGLPVEVLSGTESDSSAAYMAARLASEGVFIRDSGYDVVFVGNATHQPPHTLILCPPQYDHEAERLQQAILPGARIDQALPDHDAALRIILGSDFEEQDDGGFKAFELAEGFMAARVLGQDAERFLSEKAAAKYEAREGGLSLYGYIDGGYKVTGLMAAQEGESHQGAFRVIVQIFREGSDRTRHESLWIGPADGAGLEYQVLDVERNE